jgi:Trk K+ transport system NAD-binding subunit
MKTVAAELAGFFFHSASRAQLRPFLQFLGVLAGFVALYGVVFHLIMAWEGQDHSWFTGVYWALTVMSTLGFGDITFQSDLGRAFSSLVLITGVVLLLIILPFLFIRSVYAPWLEQRTHSRVLALRSLPEDVADHVLICANDPIAQGLIRRLRVSGVQAYLIEPDPDTAMSMSERGIPVVTGEIDSVRTYRAARADRARLVVANASDMVNSNIILTVRELSESVPIVAFAESLDSVDVLELSGATHVLTLTHRLGEQLASRVAAGSAHANVVGRFGDLLVAEFPVHNTPFQGRTVEDLDLENFTGVAIVGVWQRGRLQPAAGDLVLDPLSVPVVVGTAQQLAELDEVLVIYDANPHPVLIIGGGKVGRAAARALKDRNIPVNIVERNRELEPKIVGIPDRLILGDAAERHVLDDAGIADTPCVLLTTHDDAVNVYLTVYCRRLNPEARILTRATHRRNIEAIQRAGADLVLSYASFGEQAVFSIARGRDTVLLGGEGLSIHHIPLPECLEGKTLAEANIWTSTGLNVIAIDQDDRLLLTPSSEHELVARSELVALGSTEHRERFHEVYQSNLSDRRAARI